MTIETTTETPFREAMRAFQSGKATKAYAIFLADKTSNPETSFPSFCKGMNRILRKDEKEKIIQITNTTDRETANLIVTKAHRNGQGNGVHLEAMRDDTFRVTLVS